MGKIITFSMRMRVAHISQQYVGYAPFYGAYKLVRYNGPRHDGLKDIILTKKNIKIKKTPDELSFVIQLITILKTEASSTSMKWDGRTLEFVNKKPEDINKLDIDVDTVIKRLTHFLNVQNAYSYEPDDKHSEMLRLCIHAAYYFATEKKTYNDKAFLKHYDILKSNDYI